MQVKVLFFGVLTDVTGTVFRHYNDVKSTGDLRFRIEDDYPEIVHYNFRISLNNVLINEDAVLNDGDEVAYMPPFAGG
jgi:molybdopterin synthase sulfur carrier subunit